MPIIVACPSCGGKLRIADALVGQKVRCPACNHVFDSRADSAPPPAPLDLPLQLSLDDPSSAPPRDPGDLRGAVEINHPGEVEPDETPRPKAPPPAEPARRPPRLTELERDWDVPDIRRRSPRRDAEPDRGAVVLSLGIISLAGTVVYCAAPLWAILGLAAWIMGHTDLRKMRSGVMDENGRGITQAGWICGILGVVLNGLMMLGCGILIGGLWISEMNRPPNTRPIPMTPAPPRVVPPPQKAPPPQRQF